MIKYLGSKRRLITEILELVDGIAASMPPANAGPEDTTGLTVVDLFSGTSRVGHALKRAGHRVISNDLNAYAHALATCYVQADAQDILEEASAIIETLDALPGRAGYVTETFCEQSRYFKPENGARIDAIRAAIAAGNHGHEINAVLLTSLIEAADRVDSTTGVQMAYLKQWAPRAHNRLTLRVPDVLPRAEAGKGMALQSDAMDSIDQINALQPDLVYLDPPYNQHNYLGNYHVWESIVRNDEPEAYGIACKRVDCRERKSVFNSRPRATEAMTQLIDRLEAPYLVISFSDEGYIDRKTMEAMLTRLGTVTTYAHDTKRYVGAQIGIHNPDGDKVGTVSHLRNTEFLYVAQREAIKKTVDAEASIS